MNTQTFLKREICRWNKLLELSADHFSKNKIKKKYETKRKKKKRVDEGWGEEVKQEK